MQLTQFTDYGLRLLIHCALHEGRHVSVAEVAAAYGISRNHLAKVAQALTKRQFIDSHRGRGGGVRLARPAESLTVGTVFRAMEPTLEVINCHRPLCPLSPACVLRRALAEARESFASTLDKYTIADLVENRRVLLHLVNSRSGEAPAPT